MNRRDFLGNILKVAGLLVAAPLAKLGAEQECGAVQEDGSALLPRQEAQRAMEEALAGGCFYGPWYVLGPDDHTHIHIQYPIVGDTCLYWDDIAQTYIVGTPDGKGGMITHS